MPLQPREWLDLGSQIAGIVGLSIQTIQLTRSSGLKSLERQWEKNATYLVEVISVLDGHRIYLGEDYDKFKKECDRMERSIQEQEERVKQKSGTKMSSEEHASEMRRVTRARNQLKAIKKDAIDTSSSRKGCSDTLSFSSSIKPSKPSIYARITRGKSKQPQDVENSPDASPGPSGANSSTNIPSALTTHSIEASGSGSRDANAMGSGSLEEIVASYCAGRKIIFKFVNQDNVLVSSITSEDLVRNIDTIPDSILLPIIALGQTIAQHPRFSTINEADVQRPQTTAHEYSPNKEPISQSTSPGQELAPQPLLAESEGECVCVIEISDETASSVA